MEAPKELPKLDTDMCPAELSDMYWKLKKLALRSLVQVEHMNHYQRDLLHFIKDHSEDMATGQLMF